VSIFFVIHTLPPLFYTFFEVLAMHHFPRISSALLLSLCLASPPVSAFETSLSDEAVREAYFLGQRRDEKTALFFETYRRYLPVPNSGPHVYMVEVFTPFAEAVDVSRKHWTGYSAQQARLEYRKRGDSLRIGVHVRYTATYGPGFPYSPKQVPGQTGTWKDFQVWLTQDGKSLESRSVRYEGTRIGTGGGKSGGGSRPTGFIVWLEYEASNLASTDAAVKTDTPDGQHVVATFDLSRVR
jgi:hypothetical protein